MSSFGKLSSLSDKLGDRRRSASLDVPKENAKPGNGEDWHVVDPEGSDNGSEKPQGSESEQARPQPTNSPAPVEATLEVPPAAEEGLQGEGLRKAPLKLDTDALEAWKELHPSDADEGEGLDTDRTDYSGLGGTGGKDQELQRALEIANQQHQWAMEAVIRGWEAEKADLLAKLEDMEEARDALEAELKHSENNFAGMLDGMLDQKLDQMLLMLQENGVAPHSPTRGSPTAALQDPTVLKAQQVVSDLGCMLEAMRQQQADVEEKVGNLQTAVQHLLPAPDSGARSARSIRALPQAPATQEGSRRSVLRGPIMRIGGAFNQTSQFLRDQVPRLLTATGDVAGKAVTVPLRFTRTQAGRLNRCFHKHTTEGARVALAYASGIGAAAMASALLTHKMAGRTSKWDDARRVSDYERRASEPSIDVVCGDDRKAQEAEDVWAQHIILNSDGVFSSSSRGADASLVFAWPKLRVEWA